MITSTLPQFPTFKLLEFSDREIIDRLTKEYLPYSDFNFMSLWCWNTDQKTAFSLLHGNLVIKMKDYTTHNTIYSFLGTYQLKDTCTALLSYAKEHGVKKLSYIPEVVVKDQENLSDHFIIEEDRDQFDYIYRVSDLIHLNGPSFHNKRNLSKRYEFLHTPDVIILDINDPHTQEEIFNLCDIWNQKKKGITHEDYSNEMHALKKCIQSCSLIPSLAVGLYSQNVLTGFTLSEIWNGDYAIILYQKTTLNDPGISEYLMKSTAQHLVSHGVMYLNYEQDLGVKGLRHAKELWRPTFFLKKYTIEEKG